MLEYTYQIIEDIKNMAQYKNYSDIQSLIVAFLIKYHLTKEYLKNLKSEESCIGCTRDKGDHDGECPIDNDANYDEEEALRFNHKEARTSQSYKKQIDALIKYYIYYNTSNK